MGNWKKLLYRMANDPRPKGYHYADAARILRQLGFDVAPSSGSSHRKWRIKVGDPPRVVVIGLVEPSRGCLPREYIQDMLEILRANDLMPGGEDAG